MTDTCTLSAQSRALSTVLTAFVGGIVTGISNGPHEAFFVCMNAWFAAVRITIISAIALFVTIFGPQYGIQKPYLAQVATVSNADVTFLGSLGWIYTFIYTPPIQIMWLAANWSSASPALKVTRAIGVGVTALTYTIDTRARYGIALGRKFGSERVVPRLINVYCAAINMLLSVIVVVLLIRAVSQPGYNIPILIYGPLLYVIISIVCAASSLFWWGWPRDGPQGTDDPWLWDRDSKEYRVLIGLVVGAGAGLCVAAPAMSLWQSAKLAAETSNKGNQGMNLQHWLKCESVASWKKAVQILP